MANQLKVFVCLLLSVAWLSHAQTPGSQSVGGGTLAYEVTTNTGTLKCGIDYDQSVSWTQTIYNSFKFTSGSTTTQLGGETYSTFVNGIDTDCSSQPPSSGLPKKP